jgi:hypothetical protein
MRDNIKQRVVEFSKKVADSHWLERAKLIEDFIMKELDARDADYDLDDKDLAQIHSNAVNEGLQLSYESDLHRQTVKFMTYAWSMGVLRWLRSKDMLYFRVGVRKEAPNDNKRDKDN